MTPSAASRRPFWRRLVPPRVRLHGGLIAGSVIVMGLIAVLLGTVQIRPIVFTKEVLEAPAITRDVRGDVDLFDPSASHDIQIQVSDVEYEKMKADFVAGGDKTWIRADAFIDGTHLESVGIRLKGNSTLMSLRGGAGGPPEGGRPNMATVTFDDPSTLPLVISFDHFVEGRGYQGRTELAVRPVVGASGAALNEAVALQLVAESDQASQRFTWVRFALNGATARTRLVLENPDQNYAVALGRGAGALFKSKATNAFTYKGEDPIAYAEDFAQLSANGSIDLAPLIGLLRFVDQASDADFDAELGKWVDVESFARYVATHDLLNNFDDMSGPGRNFLLWFDAGDHRFTVVTWDMNLAITGMGGGRPGGGGPGGGGPPAFPGGGAPGPGPGGMPSGGPPGGGPPGGGQGRGPGGPGGGMRMGNTLKTRFVASGAMEPVRAAARSQLIDAWFTSGRAEAVTRELAARIPTSATLTQEAIDAEAEAVVTQLRALAEKTSKPAAVTGR